MLGGVLSEYILIIPGITWMVAQLIKMVLRFMDPRFDRTYLWSSGGMPSVHSAFMTSLATAVALKEGIFSSLTTVVICITAVVLYDAMNIRYEGGKHAKVLNMMRETTSGTPEFLREHLGHTPLEVLVGGVLGIVLGTILYVI